MWAFLVPFLAKGWERFLSILIYVLVFAGLIWACYATFVRPITKPNPTTTQTGGVSYNYNIHPTFGCMRIPVIQEEK